MIALFGLFATWSCVSIEPTAGAASSPGGEVLSMEELATVDARGTAQSVHLVLAGVRGLSAAQRAEAATALRALQLTCPFNRASVQVPIALRSFVSKTEAADLDPLIQSDWQYLRDGLEAHVAVLDILGADLPMPQEGDYLHGKLFPDAALTRAELAAQMDPVGASMPLLSSISFVVKAYDDATLAQIGEYDAVMRTHTDGAWPLETQIEGWRRALLRVRPFLADEALADEAQSVVEALDQYLGLAC